MIVETDTMDFEAVPNASMNAPSGAGISAAQNSKITVLVIFLLIIHAAICSPLNANK